MRFCLQFAVRYQLPESEDVSATRHDADETEPLFLPWPGRYLLRWDLCEDYSGGMQVQDCRLRRSRRVVWR